MSSALSNPSRKTTATFVRASIPELNACVFYVVSERSTDAALAAVGRVAPLSWPLLATDYELKKATLRRLALIPGEPRRLA